MVESSLNIFEFFSDAEEMEKYSAIPLSEVPELDLSFSFSSDEKDSESEDKDDILLKKLSSGKNISRNIIDQDEKTLAQTVLKFFPNEKLTVSKEEAKISKKMISYSNKLLNNLSQKDLEIDRLRKSLDEFFFNPIVNEKSKMRYFTPHQRLILSKMKLSNLRETKLKTEFFINKIDCTQTNNNNMFVYLEIPIVFLSEIILDELAQFLKEKEKNSITQNFSSHKQKRRIEFTFAKNENFGKFKFVLHPVRSLEVNIDHKIHQLLRIFCRMSQTFHPFLVFVHEWATKREILNFEFLHPTGLNAMIIFFFQQMRIIPPIKELLKPVDLTEYDQRKLFRLKKNGEVIKIPLELEEDPKLLKEKFDKNSKDVTENVFSFLKFFFKYYAENVPDSELTIDCYTGTFQKRKKPTRGYSINHPFFEIEICQKLCWEVNREEGDYDDSEDYFSGPTEEYQAVNQEFKRAMSNMKENKIQNLMERYIPEKK